MINLDQEPSLIKKEILNLPLSDQDHWISLWICKPEVLKDMRKRPEPTPPIRVKEFFNYTPQIKKNMRVEPEKYDSFWKDEIVVKFFEDRQAIRNINYRNERELTWAKKILKNDPEKVLLIDAVLVQYMDIPEPINYTRPDAHWQD